MNKLTVRIFSMKNCSYCEELKERLIEMNIEFTDVDINSKKGKEEFEIVGRVVKTDYVPIIIVGRNVLIPETSFQTIEQASNIVKNLLTKTD